MTAARGDQALSPPRFLQTAGHPLRWRLLNELARSDRRVHELTALVHQPQNVVSYHLAALRDAQLVSSRRSAADRRDTYYAVDLARFGELLTGVGRSLHVGLRLAREPVLAGRAPVERVAPGVAAARVLFLCTGNSARSQIAEALARARSHGAVDAHSAGSHPKPLHPNAARVLRDDHGIDLGDPTTKHVSLYVGQRFDRVVTLCDRVREVCPTFGRTEPIHWSIADPAAGHDPGDHDASYPDFRRAAAELATRIDFLLAALAAPDDSAAHPPEDQP